MNTTTTTMTTMTTTDAVASPSSFGYLDNGPFCMVVLEQQQRSGTKDTNTNFFNVVQINRAFERHISPMFKMAEINFMSLVTEQSQPALLEAIAAAATKATTTASSCSDNHTTFHRARNVEMMTLAACNSGLPVKRHFDWTVGTTATTTTTTTQQIVLYGDPCTDVDVEQRAKDSELVDFFQNAPIALHWLSGEGVVLWANQTELDVLGYTAEEYIGQPIMKFCPDEQELVLEIFKQLGSGNSIADVPVRFRTKDGRIVDLLIDSNVRYDDAGKFAHTRCFIRDDTKRKVREARALLLQEETKRSLQMMDNFMSRSLHHMRSPLHVLLTSVDIVKAHLSKISTRIQVVTTTAADDNKDLVGLVDDCDFLLNQAGIHVSKAVDMIDDISDLARLDQGQQLKIGCELIQLKDLGKEVFANVDVPSGVEVALELTGGGPSFIHSDSRYLKKILCNLVDHVSNNAAPYTADAYGRTVTLNIGHTADCCIFTVVEAARGALDDSVSSMEVDGEVDDKVVIGGLPAIFQRYHQELLPEEMNNDLVKAGDQRNKIESEINSLRVNNVGMGLSLSYHLVSALGGDLRYLSRPPDMTKFWFSIPHNNGELSSERIVFDRHKLRRPSLFIKPDEKCAVQYNQALVASQGLRAMDSPSVLVVEDVPICAKLLCTILRQFKCSAKWVKNGQEAVDLLTKEPDMYNLILMDLRMPVMDGLTATKIIKDTLKMKTPVVALTGEGGDQIREECRLIGFDEYCNKPMKREELLRVIQEHTGYVHKG